MENREPSWQEESPSEDKKERKSKKTGEGVFGLFLSRLRMEEEQLSNDAYEPETEEGPESKKPSKKKRFASLFRRIFGGVAQVEHQATDSAADDTINRETLWSGLFASDLKDQIQPEETSNESQFDHPASEANDRPVINEVTNNDQVEASETTEPAKAESNKTEDRVDVLPEHDELEPHQDESDSHVLQINNRDILMNEVNSYSVRDKQDQDTKQQDQTSRNHQQINPWGPAIIVDQLARSRDRKLSREMKSAKKDHQHEISDQKKILDRVEKQAERYSKDSNARIENLESLSQQQEAYKPQPQASEVYTDKLPRQNSTEQRREPISPEEMTQEHNILASKERMLGKGAAATSIEQQLKPEVVISRVEDKVEKNEPIEQAFEKSHEAKQFDQQTNDVSAASVGTVLHDLKNKDYKHVFSANIHVGSQSHNNTSHSVNRPSTGYKSAATSGFYAGLVIVAIMIVIAVSSA